MSENRPEWCICHDDYVRRGRYDPACRHDELLALDDQATSLRRTLAKLCKLFDKADTAMTVVGAEFAGAYHEFKDA